MDFSNREIATLIWFGALIALPFLFPKARGTALAILKWFSHRLVLAVFGFASLYAVGCIALLARSGIWTPGHLKTTLWWAATIGFVSMFDITRIDEDRTYFAKTIRDTTGMTAIFIFIVQFYSFSLPVELIFVPFMGFLGVLLATASKPEFATADKFLKGLLTTIGVGLVAYASWETVRYWSQFATVETLREFLIPVLLTFLFLPFLYAMSVYSVYENVFIGLNWAVKDDRLRRFAQCRAILNFRFNLDLLKRWRRVMMQEHPEERDAIRQSFREVKRLNKVEQNPPSVDPSAGWSPYAAKEFLTDVGVESGDYHHSYGEWRADSKILKIEGSGALGNSIVYYVEGAERTATQLILELMVNNIEAGKEADKRFATICQTLLVKALGESSAELLPGSLADFEEDCAKARVGLKTETWTVNKFQCYQRTLTIAHAVHIAVYPTET
jgi:hypothetical protein